VHDFAQRVRARYGDSPYRPDDILKACEEHARFGLEVVCRDDAVFVGPWCLAFQYNAVSGIRLEEEWMLFVTEWGTYDIPIPVELNARAEAARMVDYYTNQWEEEQRRYLQERQAPMWRNRLLNIAEAHFVWVLLGLFFIAIPLPCSS
jgi:hypothetical protein